MSDGLTTLGSRVEQRFVHALSSSSGVIQKRANGWLGRASRTVRRGSVVLALGWLGLALFSAAWVMFNLALHAWLVARGSVVTAHLVAMGVNLGGGALLILTAALLAPSVEKQLHGRQRRTQANADDRAHAQAQMDKERPVLLAAPAEPAPDSLESALGAAIELGMFAARTIPQIVRSLRKRPPASTPQTRE